MTVLQSLDDAQVFSAAVSQDRASLVFMDSCDRYYSFEISKEDVYKLVTELTLLADSLSDTPQPYDPLVTFEQFKQNLINKLGTIKEQP